MLAHIEQTTVVLLSLCIVSLAANDLSQCVAPLGMESGSIKDEDISASSSFDSGNVGPHHGRVRTEKNGGAWCPQTPATAEPEEWLQVDLHTVYIILSVGTQGRFGNGQGVEYAEAYVIEYWRPGLTKWIRYRTYNSQEVLTGNINTYLEAKLQLNPPLWASKVRFLPYSYHRRTVCMRVELYGCRWIDGIISYSMPQGDKRGTNWEFYDTAYDGYWDGGKLGDGLGLLSDGQIGPDDFKKTYYDHSQGWVGWRSDNHEQHYVEITYKFDHVREFSAVHIYCNNQFTKDVKVFSKAYIMFSINGKRYQAQSIFFVYIEDRMFESPRNVSIKLHQRIGKYVMLRLYFAARWILISEITFNSDIVTGNFTEPDNEQQTLIPQNGITAIPELEHKVTVVSSASSDAGQYLGVVAGLLLILSMLISFVVGFMIIQHKRHKNSLVQIQAHSSSKKTVLYNEPNFGKIPLNSSYSDVQDSEYAVPLQPPHVHAPSCLQDGIPKPPPVPPVPERYYAATEICNPLFVPPLPPFATSPLARINRHPIYASNVNPYIGP